MHSHIFFLCLPLQTFSRQDLEKLKDLEQCWKTSHAEYVHSPVQNTCKERLDNSESRNFFPLILYKCCSAEHLMPGTTAKAKKLTKWPDHSCRCIQMNPWWMVSVGTSAELCPSRLFSSMFDILLLCLCRPVNSQQCLWSVNRTGRERQHLNQLLN